MLGLVSLFCFEEQGLSLGWMRWGKIAARGLDEVGEGAYQAQTEFGARLRRCPFVLPKMGATFRPAS